MDRRELQRELTQETLTELLQYERSSLTEKKLKVTHQTMWLWRSGKNLPNAKHMIKLLEILKFYKNRSNRA